MEYLIRDIDEELMKKVKINAASKDLKVKGYILELLKERCMDYTIESAMANEHIHSVERRVFSVYTFKVGVLSPTITIRTYKEENGSGYLFEMSHTIHTPEQIDPYRPGRPWGDYEGYAVQQAITAITDFYRIAVDKGHKPNDGWLVKNESFREI